MKEKTQNVMGVALIALTLLVGFAAAATGTAVGTQIGVAVLALGLAMWLVRTWLRGPEMGRAQRYAQVIVPVMAIAVLAPAVVLATSGMAGAGGTDFAGAYNRVEAWATGDLGRVISVGLLVVGVAAGIVRQSIMAAVPAAGAGLALSLGPGIITQIFTATL